MYLKKHRRRRGVLLTPQGFNKLRSAKSNMENWENSGHRYTLEVLSQRTGLSPDTLTKVLKCESSVDKQSIELCFKAFNLVLEASDYFCPDPAVEEQEKSNHYKINQNINLELPGGQVPLNSAFYVERSPVETECYQTIQQPGSLIRIKAPRLMGKTSLMARILHQATNLGYKAVSLNFQLADKAIFQDLDKFLRWFCVSVGLEVKLPNQLETFWDEIFGSKISSKIYFEQYLLTQTKQPIILCLDDVDSIFPYPEIAEEFFGLLRSWYEEAKNKEIWKKLRLVVAHSTEVCLNLNINKSPFNVGLPIELKPFTNEQIQYLAQQHQLNWSEQKVQKLMSLVGGQPHLIRLGFYHLYRQNITLEQFLSISLTTEGIYNPHLQGKLLTLQQDPELASIFAQIVKTPTPIVVDLVHGFKLQSMGLIELQGNLAICSCNLYRKYFSDRLN